MQRTVWCERERAKRGHCMISDSKLRCSTCSIRKAYSIFTWLLSWRSLSSPSFFPLLFLYSRVRQSQQVRTRPERVPRLRTLRYGSVRHRMLTIVQQLLKRFSTKRRTNTLTTHTKLCSLVVTLADPRCASSQRATSPLVRLTPGTCSNSPLQNHKLHDQKLSNRKSLIYILLTASTWAREAALSGCPFGFLSHSSCILFWNKSFLINWPKPFEFTLRFLAFWTLGSKV